EFRFASLVQATQLKSTIATGTAPLIVASTTMVTNLNAEALGGTVESEVVLYAGRSGGSTVKGGTGAGENFTLESTGHATKGKLLLGATGDHVFDEVNGRLGLGQATPLARLHVEETGTAKANLDIMQIVNAVNAADMDGTRTSILWRLARVTDTLLDAGRIGFEAADDWTVTGSTQDADFVLEQLEQGVMTEKFRISSDPNGGFATFFARLDSRRGDGVSNPFRIFSFADADELSPQFSMRRALGTFATPTALVVGTEVGALEWRGMDATSGTHRRKASVRSVVDGSVSSNVVPMAIMFATSATSANPISRLTIDSAGDVTLDTPGAQLNFFDANHYITQANGMLEYNCVTGRGHSFRVQSANVADIDTGEIRFYTTGTEQGSIAWTTGVVEIFATTAVRALRWTATAMQVEKPTLIGSSTTAPATSAILELVSTTGALLVSSMTTTQRNALTAVNGMIMYNLTTNQFNFREGGAWVTGSGLA
ncbi:hypothetical protein LCGC14_2079490, partial [marine sediment metagenome]